MDKLLKYNRAYHHMISEAEKLYKDRLNEYLKENNLDGDMIRISDNARGVFKVIGDTYGGIRIKFYKYTKKGEIALNGSGCFIMSEKDFNEFRKADMSF